MTRFSPRHKPGRAYRYLIIIISDHLSNFVNTNEQSSRLHIHSRLALEQLNMSTEVVAKTEATSTQVHGMRKNGGYPDGPPSNHFSLTVACAGKQWHEAKTAFRPKAGNTSYAKRIEQEKALAAIKAKEKEMKEEKEAERQVRPTSSANLAELCR